MAAASFRIQSWNRMRKRAAMGASGWEYYVPYQEDLGAALTALREKIFEEQDYYWDPADDDGEPRFRPATIDELWEDEQTQEEGTHSILDMDRIGRPGEPPTYGTVRPLGSAEATERVGTDRLTRAHVPALAPLTDDRWHGRCVVLHTAEGAPREIYFWGVSGD
ncbi:hypothetical protein ACIQAC_20365 [Streptomyces sp. NPDC088387]|uniref:hypothetical protein n=1 Tax=Streptomyces sp. NPDC088387 TaxID=3365859 RepID=UPI0038176FF4